MTQPGMFTPYSTAAQMFSQAPGWVPELDKERIQSYQVYEEIYWNHPTTFRLIVRGTENKPIYIPSGRVIVDTANRFVGKGFNFQVTTGVGTDSEQALAKTMFTALMRREAFFSRFQSNKRYGIIRGDWIWHITADPLKPEGQRIRIMPVDPGSYFPVYSDDDLDRLIKVHLAEQFIDEKGDVRVRRQTYERDENGVIYTSTMIFEPDKWTASDAGPVAVLVDPTPLPADITAFPVYHIRNFDEPGNPFGSSEMRGLERIMAAVNQAMSDSDIALALEGIGVYATDSDGPVDESGQPTSWTIAPGKVIENAGEFRRVPGVGSLGPYGEHVARLVNFLREAGGTPDAAVGKVDVQVAESGVALALQLAPILAKAEEKDQILLDVHTQMFYDLQRWFAVYEGANFLGAEILPVLGDKLPTNRRAEVDLVTALMSTVPPIMSATTARLHLAKFGFSFSANESALVAQEQSMMTEAQTPPDAFGDRMGQELNEEDESENAGGNDAAV